MSVQTKATSKLYTNFRWTWLLLLLVPLPFLGSLDVQGQGTPKTVAEVRTIYPSEWGVPYPAGLSYSLTRDHLALTAQNAGQATENGATVVIITPYEDLVGTATLPFSADNAMNIAYDDHGIGHLLIVHNGQAELAQISVGETGVPDPATLTHFDIAHLGLQSVEGMAVAFDSRQLFLLDSTRLEIVSADPDNLFNLVARLDLSHLGVTSVRGIAVHPISHNLFIVSLSEKILYELTQSGQLVNTYDLAGLALVDPRGLAFGPSADLTDAPDLMHLFLADSNLPDSEPGTVTQPLFGRVLEVALEPGSGGGSIQTVTAQIASSHDDSEEKLETGATSLDSSDLELIEHNGDQLVGVRFDGMNIPIGATIIEAHIEFVADTKGDASTSLTFHGEATDDSAPFADGNGDISARSLTTAHVTWLDVPAWTVAHEAHRTPDLAPIVQEIVDRGGWRSGNAIAFIVSGTGNRTAEAYDGEPALAPRLVVNYQEPLPESTPSPLPTPMPIIHVPGDASTIQAGIDLASDGDVVLVAPGEYRENIQIAGKTITLASQFYTTDHPGLIDETIIDGDGNPAITVESSVGPNTKIIGFTIRNADDGISAFGKLTILNNRFIGNKDAIDYEAGGGVCSGNVFDSNRDDAIDLDGPTEVVIEDNIIRSSGDDGIEIRLHPYSGPVLNITIRDNHITDSDEDGIQLIGYPPSSDRVFRIERNVIQNSAQAGMGLMDNGETKEDFRGASIPERILLFNNTFIDNDHGLSGGDNLVAVNNIFVGSHNIALKNVDGNSIAAYNLFWDNGFVQQNATLDTTNTIVADPRLDENARLQPDSPAIDVGTALFTWQSEVVLDVQPASYFGIAPDLGAHERGESLHRDFTD